MMLFQSDIDVRGTEAWTLGGNFLASVAAIKSVLREADIQGALFQSSDGLNNGSLVEVLRSPDELVLVAVNIDAYNYSDKFCVLREKGPQSHWIFNDHVIDRISIDIPKDMILSGSKSLSDVFEVSEVINGEFRYDIKDATISFDNAAGQLIVSSLKLDGADYVSRLFILRSK